MRIGSKYSHLNGEEWLLVHERDSYQEILDVIGSIDTEECRTKVSKEKGIRGKRLYSPVELNKEFASRLSELGWESTRYSYYTSRDHEQVEEMMHISLEDQRRYLLERGETPIFSYKQIDHVRNRIAVGVQFGKSTLVAYDIFVKHPLFYIDRVINVGIEILPMKSMQSEMSSGIAYYEGEVYNVLRHGRTNPPVPLLIIGIEPD